MCFVGPGEVVEVQAERNTKLFGSEGKVWDSGSWSVAPYFHPMYQRIILQGASRKCK